MSQNPTKTFNDVALEKVCHALDYLEHDRLHEAYVLMRGMRADLLLQIGKERRDANRLQPPKA